MNLPSLVYLWREWAIILYEEIRATNAGFAVSGFRKIPSPSCTSRSKKPVVAK